MKHTIYILTGVLATAMVLHAQTNYRVTGRYAVAGTEGWDYVTLDSEARRLYISHNTQVDVLDADSGKSAGTIADTPGVHGIVIATGMNRGFISNGMEDKVSIFDI